MGLQQISTNNVTSNVSSVSLTGIDDDSVYMVACNNIFFDNNDDMKIRFTVSGTADSSSNYDFSTKNIHINTSFSNTGLENQSSIDTNQGTGTSSDHQINLIMYLYNFNKSDEFSFATIDNAHRNTSQNRTALFSGGAVLTEAQTTDGVHFFLGSGNNFANGTFTLYKVV